MNESSLMLVGGGGHCCSIIDVLECCGLPVAGIVHGPACEAVDVMGYPCLGRDADLPRLRGRYSAALVTVGQIASAGLRKKLFGLLCDLRFHLPTATAPSARLARAAVLGAGSVVMHRAVVNSGAQVGVNCIINTGALVEHGSVIGDHCHISTGAIVNGDVRVGEETFIGSGALLKHGISIGKNCVVGMGAKVCRSLPDNTVFTDEHACFRP